MHLCNDFSVALAKPQSDFAHTEKRNLINKGPCYCDNYFCTFEKVFHNFFFRLIQEKKLH